MPQQIDIKEKLQDFENIMQLYLASREDKFFSQNFIIKCPEANKLTLQFLSEFFIKLFKFSSGKIWCNVYTYNDESILNTKF